MRMQMWSSPIEKLNLAGSGALRGGGGGGGSARPLPLAPVLLVRRDFVVFPFYGRF